MSELKTILRHGTTVLVGQLAVMAFGVAALALVAIALLSLLF